MQKCRIVPQVHKKHTEIYYKCFFTRKLCYHHVFEKPAAAHFDGSMDQDPAKLRRGLHKSQTYTSKKKKKNAKLHFKLRVNIIKQKCQHVR